MGHFIRLLSVSILLIGMLSLAACSRGRNNDQYSYEQEEEYLVVDPKYGFSKRHQAQFNRSKRQEEKAEKKEEMAKKKARRQNLNR